MGGKREGNAMCGSDTGSQASRQVGRREGKVIVCRKTENVYK